MFTYKKNTTVKFTITCYLLQKYKQNNISFWNRWIWTLNAARSRVKTSNDAITLATRKLIYISYRVREKLMYLKATKMMKTCRNLHFASQNIQQNKNAAQKMGKGGGIPNEFYWFLQDQERESNEIARVKVMSIAHTRRAF